MGRIDLSNMEVKSRDALTPSDQIGVLRKPLAITQRSQAPTTRP
jgi:hypothetical protein